MIRSLTRSPIRKGIRSLIGGGFGFAYGLPFVTSDGYALFTLDDEVLLASNASTASASDPNPPLFTSDGFALFDIDNNLLLGA